MAVISHLGPQSGTVSQPSGAKALAGNYGFSAVLNQMQDYMVKPQSNQSERVDLGIITRENYTVSHLLFKNREFASKTWDIIHNPLNQSKDFTRMEPGTRVYLDASTGEVSWDREKTIPSPEIFSVAPTPSYHPPASMNTTDDLSKGLVQAVSQEIGKKYDDVDCYELVVRGLSRLGVRYGGRGGLKSALMDKAMAANRAPNAYLTGEGLVSACGQNLYRETIVRIDNPESTARRVFDELSASLRPGAILSLSTRSRGHTGVVSARDNQWTYINSGRMDNNLRDRVPSQGVGEEDLLSELVNWFKRAKSRNEALSITLGELSRDKLMAFAGQDERVALV